MRRQRLKALVFLLNGRKNNQFLSLLIHMLHQQSIYYENLQSIVTTPHRPFLRTTSSTATYPPGIDVIRLRASFPTGDPSHK